MNDEEYVRANWEWVEVRLARPFEGLPEGKWTAMVPHFPYSNFIFNCEADAWATLADFTRVRREDIRQVKREIETVEDSRDFERLKLEMSPFWSDDDPMPAEEDFNAQADCVVFWVRRIIANARIIAHLQAKLDDLCRGMKEESQPPDPGTTCKV